MTKPVNKGARSRIKRKALEVEPVKSYRSGRIDLDNLGAQLGWYTPTAKTARANIRKSRYPILNGGRIQVGITTHVVGLSVGYRHIFIGRDGSLWRFKGALLVDPVPTTDGLDKSGMRAWADACARAVIDRLSPKNEIAIIEDSHIRYRKIVKALVQERMLDAAGLGHERNARIYAKGICSGWDERDLLFPRHATIRHATLVALVLALDANKAAQLIELAALIEMRIPFVSRDAAISIYQQSASLLARLCPQWWNRGYICDWDMVGNIDRLFRGQYIQMIERAWDSGTQFETAAGLTIRNLVRDPGDMGEGGAT
mgnify:CR=1 FL=1